MTLRSATARPASGGLQRDAIETREGNPVALLAPPSPRRRRVQFASSRSDPSLLSLSLFLASVSVPFSPDMPPLPPPSLLLPLPSPPRRSSPLIRFHRYARSRRSPTFRFSRIATRAEDFGMHAPARHAYFRIYRLTSRASRRARPVVKNDRSNFDFQSQVSRREQDVYCARRKINTATRCIYTVSLTRELRRASKP